MTLMDIWTTFINEHEVMVMIEWWFFNEIKVLKAFGRMFGRRIRMTFGW